MILQHSCLWLRGAVIAVSAVAVVGCADVVGADFDVHAACETCPVVLADELAYPKSVAVADGFVFWVESADPGRVMKVPVDGGEPIEVSTVEHQPNQIAARDGYVYWTTTLLEGGAVRRAKTGGGPVEDVAPEQNGAIGLAVDDTRVYWGSQVSQSLRAAPLDALPGGGAALAADIGSISLLALDGGDVFFSQFGDEGGLWRVSKSGGDAVKLMELANANAVAVAGDMVCVTSFFGGTAEEVVDCVGKDGNGRIRIAGAREQPTGMVSRGDRLYWGELGLGAIVTGAPFSATSVLVDGQDGPNGLAIDGDTLYWANFVDGGSIVKKKLP